MKCREIKIELLKDISDRDFNPYGQIMGIERGKPLEDFTYLRYWPKNVDLGDDIEEIDLGFLVCTRTDDGITRLERHKRTYEILFPTGTGESIWVMAPYDNSRDRPDISGIRAFYLDGTLGMCLHKGTWHWAPVCMRDRVKFMVLLKGGLEDPTDYVDLGFELKLVI